MKLNPVTTTAAALLAATLASAPAFAQERDAKRREATRESKGSSGRSEGAQPQRQAPAQPQAPPQAAPQAQPKREAAAPRHESRPQDVTPRVETRGDGIGRAVPRREVTQPRTEAPAAQRYNDERRVEGERRAEAERRVEAERRHDIERRVERRYDYSPRYGHGPRVYYRPYVFRPRISIGFGIFAGYPVPYSYRYSAPINIYGYMAPRAPVYVEAGSSLYGGVALDITPTDSDVFVDGSYAGRVEDFDGTTQPLTLAGGTHRIEVQAPGYAPLVFDVNIVPGEVVPYRGDLRQ